jgi:hypothetical protein
MIHASPARRLFFHTELNHDMRTHDFANLMQLTQEQAVACSEQEHWKDWTPLIRALFQIHQDRLCMPFSVFHEAVEGALGRPVFTHELGLNLGGLKAELLGLSDAPTLEQILALLPQDKTIVVSI